MVPSAARLFLLFCCIIGYTQTQAQGFECKKTDTVFNLNFGAGQNVPIPRSIGYGRYRNAWSPCPDDGNYAFASFTYNCFGGRWINLDRDHTPGDVNGNMMIVNAAERSGDFLVIGIDNLTPGAWYELSAWVVNILKSTDGCTPSQPNLSFSVETKSGKALTTCNTGRVPQLLAPVWQGYKCNFSLPAGDNAIVLKIRTTEPGGCGNDFAIDDIVVSECKPTIISPPVNKEIPVAKPVKKETKPVVVKPVIKEEKKTPPAVKPVKKEEKVNTVVTPVKKEEPSIQPKVVTPTLPPANSPLVKRENPVIKTIQTRTNEIVIELYDNGDIDGDTVSIYHNNVLILSRAGISDKASTIRILVDKNHPHHELVMVAENLGSIPPNTALMVITAGDKRYETFISTSEQKNAKLVVEWIP